MPRFGILFSLYMKLFIDKLIQCAKMIITSGIKKVVFKELYRDESGLNLLKQYGVEIIQIKEDYEYWWL